MTTGRINQGVVVKTFFSTAAPRRRRRRRRFRAADRPPTGRAVSKTFLFNISRKKHTSPPHKHTQTERTQRGARRERSAGKTTVLFLHSLGRRCVLLRCGSVCSFVECARAGSPRCPTIVWMTRSRRRARTCSSQLYDFFTVILILLSVF